MGEKFRARINWNYKKLFVLLMTLWFVSLCSLVSLSYRKISSGIKKELSNKAMIIALDIAKGLEMDEFEYDRLMSLSYFELLKDKANVDFEQRARNIMSYSDIKYIYILSRLPDSVIKYKVEHGEEEIYNMEKGSPLNAIYLLDATASYDVRLEDTGWSWYENKDRYSAMDKEHTMAYESEKPGYFVSTDKWGTYLTGYAPVYLNNRKHIGMVGVDVYMNQYLSLVRSNLYIILGFVLTNIVIAILTIYLLFKIHKVDKKMKETIIISCTDCLTSTLNRLGFMELLEKKWDKGFKEKKPLSLLFIDLDFFKQYNDNYGHLAGDENLRSISLLLSEKTEIHRGVVGRYGGDEFMILLPNFHKEKAEELAEEIIKGTHELDIKHEYSSICNYQTVSIGGVSIIPSNKISIETLMNYADMALYEVKKSGRNKAIIYDKIES